jgi:hypothetical protein
LGRFHPHTIVLRFWKVQREKFARAVATMAHGGL